MQVALREACGIIEVSRATVCRTLKRAGFSPKQVRQHVAPVFHDTMNLYYFTAYPPSPRMKRGMPHHLQDTDW